jgi:hypothetical protein
MNYDDLLIASVGGFYYVLSYEPRDMEWCVWCGPFEERASAQEVLDWRCDMCDSNDNVDRLDDGSLVCAACVEASEQIASKPYDVQCLVRKAYRQAWKERGVSDEVVEQSIYCSEDDKGNWSPTAYVIMTTEQCLPISTHMTEDIDLAVEIDKRASELCGFDVYTEFHNSAILAVYAVA